MIDFYDTIVKKLDIPIEKELGYKLSVYDSFGVHIEGHKGLLSYTPTKIIIRLKKKQAVVEGDSLNVYYASKEELYIRGKITTFSLIEG